MRSIGASSTAITLARSSPCAASIICARQPRSCFTSTSGRSSANGSLPIRSRAHHTAWPRPSGSCWRVKLVVPAPGSSCESSSRSFTRLRSCKVISSSNCRSKWSSITPLFRPVTKMKCSMPASLASSTTCWISGRSTTGSISFGMALVAGRKRVPRPATGNTVLRIGFVMRLVLLRKQRSARETPADCAGKAPRPYNMASGAIVAVHSFNDVTVNMGGLRAWLGVKTLGLTALGLTAAALIASADPAAAQSFDIRLLFSSPSKATPPQEPASQTPREWTGEDGASGHPLMRASAIRAAAANFRQCLDEIWPLAQRRNVPRPVFDKLLAGVTPDLRIMDLLDSQPEFTRAPWEYLDGLVSDTRIADGRAILAKYRPQFDAMEKAYGVDRHIIAAIWGVESNYGTMIGDRSVIRSTATLACIGRRQDFFREELLAALEIVARGDVRPEHLLGSWAGAFGPTQFMPTTYRRFAVDADGDGRRDVVESVPDLLASTANHLKREGWISGQSWGYEVILPKGFNYLLADRSEMKTIAAWERTGIRRAGGKSFPRANDRAFLLVPAGAQGPAFLMLQNFRAIMKYNSSETYALAIGHLADRLRGGDAFVQAWPRHERMLSHEERLELQQLLARSGYDVGEPDGRFGPRTRNALRAFQQAVGTTPDGFATVAILERLRSR